MLFQGQEFLEGGWFRDTVPVDWDKREEFRGIVRLYRDLIRLAAQQERRHARAQRPARPAHTGRRCQQNGRPSAAGWTAGQATMCGGGATSTVTRRSNFTSRLPLAWGMEVAS